MAFDLTCVITAHREGRISLPSLHSFDIAVSEANAAGLSVETLYYLDDPDYLTRELFKRHVQSDESITELSLKDQGLVRNHAARKAKGHYIAFLDADDLWARAWLVEAIAFLTPLGGKVIAHPEYNYFFESSSSIFCHVDCESKAFDLDLLRLVNYWDALCICETEVYRNFPFGERAVDAGWAYEDWYWNCETMASGYAHKIVPGTIIFKRRQRISQTIHASARKSRIRANQLLRYDHHLYNHDSN